MHMIYKLYSLYISIKAKQVVFGCNKAYEKQHIILILSINFWKLCDFNSIFMQVFPAYCLALTLKFAVWIKS